MSTQTTPSPLRRLAELRGGATEAAEAAIALWSDSERELLVRLGVIDRAHGDFSLTAAGQRVLDTSS